MPQMLVPSWRLNTVLLVCQCVAVAVGIVVNTLNACSCLYTVISPWRVASNTNISTSQGTPA
jgi:hypothetical protein